MKKINTKTLCTYGFGRWDIIFFALAAAVSFFFMSHPDLWETARMRKVAVDLERTLKVKNQWEWLLAMEERGPELTSRA